MKRFRLSAKLAMAIIPIGLVALLAAGFIANSFLRDSAAQSESARAATVSAETLDTLNAIWDEQSEARRLFVFFDSGAAGDYATAVEETDAAFVQLESSISALGSASEALIDQARISAREQVEAISAEVAQLRSIDTPTATEIERYNSIAEDILSIMPKFSSLVSDRIQARDLTTAYFLAEGGQVSFRQEQLIEEFEALAYPTSSATATSNSRTTLQATLDILERDFASWGLRAAQTADAANSEVARFATPAQIQIDTFPDQRNDEILKLGQQLTTEVASTSSANAGQSEREAYLVAGVAAIILLLALWGSYAVIRSVVRRVRGVTTAATQVSEVDLPKLVEALQNPIEDLDDLKPTVFEAAGSDEVGDLAHSFTSLHTTLIDVAGQQMDILRKGVSEIFVTLARRNRSLVDRQLALLDELEAREEDAETLGGYYQLDHLATRMRRNAESLLVLAGSEPTRIWSNPLEVSEIIRAALGEVDEYQRVDIMALEPAMISGRAVADIAHLMSELLDNGTQYSSPADRVRVAGLFDPEGYMLTVSDSGIGMSESRLAELNHLLESPPVLGLALQPTLGMYVVARLAARHNVRVQLISGSPGLTVRVLLTKTLIEAPPAKEDPSPEPVSRPAVEPTQEYRPAIAASGPIGASSNGGYSNRHAATFAEQVADSPQPADTPVSEVGPRPEVVVEGSSALPGSVKGKHEVPGRPRAVSTPIDNVWASGDADLEYEIDSESPISEQVNETFAENEDAAPSTLSRRVPGQTLSAEQELPELEEVLPPSQPLERPTQDDSPWWAKEVAEPSPAKDEGRSLWDDIDEQKPELDIPDEPPALVEDPAISDAGLPVRTPGVSFTETDESSVSSAASESGAIGIKSALTSFAGGRELAGGQRTDKDGDAPEGRDE